MVPLDIDSLKREADPHPDTSAYVAVIQAGEHLWFRTRDIGPDRFWPDLQGAIRLLGSRTDLPTGETQLVLAAPVKRHVIVRYPDGRPKANFDLNVSVYLWDQNHCGVHEGLPLAWISMTPIRLRSGTLFGGCGLNRQLREPGCD